MLATSCQKTITAVEVSNGTDTTIVPGLLVRSVSLWSDGTNPATDSTVTVYTYDALGLLAKKEQTGQQPIFYNRDALERLTSMITPTGTGDTAYTRVYYVNATASIVSYVLYSITSLTGKPDSMAFTYTNAGSVNKTGYYNGGSGARQLSYYQTWTFDANYNVTQLKQFTADDALNISYDFEYDNKPNPLRSPDDARLPFEWGYTLSPNNIVKQTNHYGSSSPGTDDYVTYTYVYNSGNKPVTGTHSGTAIGTQTEAMRFYYH